MVTYTVDRNALITSPCHLTRALANEHLDTCRLQTITDLQSNQQACVPDVMPIRISPRRYSIDSVMSDDELNVIELSAHDLYVTGTIVAPELEEFDVKLAEPTVNMVMPQQPFEIHCNNAIIDCLIAPVRLELSCPIDAIRVRRSSATSYKPDRFMLLRDFHQNCVDQDIHAMNELSVIQQIHNSHRLAMPVEFIPEAYEFKYSRTVADKYRYRQYMWGRAPNKFAARTCITAKGKTGYTRVGSIVYNPRVVVRCLYPE